MMDRTCDEYIERMIELANELMILADEGDASGADDDCHILFGIVRDCAYKIMNEAERQRYVI